MATANAASTSSPPAVMDATSPQGGGGGGGVGEDASVKAVHKRYEGLMTVRTKAIRGKGAWYWAHLEPIIVQSTDTGAPKAVKLRCALCDAVFSASNPSRTASEHLKRGTCPNFTSPSSSSSAAAAVAAAAAASSPTEAATPKPMSSVRPCSSSSPSPHLHQHHSNSRKRSAPSSAAAASNSSPTSYHVPHLAIIDPSRFSSTSPTAPLAGEVFYPTPPPPALLPPPPRHQIVLSGGKEDLGALAMLEDSVRKLKSPKASPGFALSKAQVECALAFLSDWVYECAGAGAVSLSSIEHPKFRSFLSQVGLPPVSRHDLFGSHLDAHYDEARADADSRIRDALFFQLAADGWKPRDPSSASGVDTLVNLTVNLPNGTTVFHRTVLTHGRPPAKYAEELLWETVADVCRGSLAQRCAGIVADRFKSKALRSLEEQHHWMVNLSCQLQGFQSLVKDFARELPIFQTVVTNCYKLASYFNGHSQVRGIFHKYQLQELDHAALLRVPASFDLWGGDGSSSSSSMHVFAMLDDILISARAVQLVVLDESYKLVCLDDPNARELADMIRDMGFWNELDAVHSLIKLIKDMIQEMEVERPLVGQCLPLWNDLRSKLKDWCTKFSMEEAPVKKVIEKRFKKCYHPAWSAAFILDPLYLMKDASGKYLPPFKCLTPEQEKDVDKLITRMVSRDEAHIALMELMKWRTEGLDPLYAQAVQVKQLDLLTGKMKIANPQSSRLVWETCLSEFKFLGKVAVRLIFLHATSCGFKCSPMLLRWVSAQGHPRTTSMERAHKLVFIAANAKLDRKDFVSEEEKDAGLLADGEDDVLNEAAFVETPSV